LDNIGKTKQRLHFLTFPSIAILPKEDNDIVGFACFESTAKNFFGPTGTSGKHEGKRYRESFIGKKSTGH
jgi:hypothetical protein